MSSEIYLRIFNKAKTGQKQFAVLVDPDNYHADHLMEIVDLAEKVNVDYFFVGGSLLTQDNLADCISIIKSGSSIPVILFPGNTLQVDDTADAILFLSLISGRNPDMLIGKHVIVASRLKASTLDVIPTGYMLIDGGQPTSVSYMSNTTPIPAEKNDIGVSTAIAGELLGTKLIYMDAGSGAINPVSTSMISAVKSNINIPLIVGGGIATVERAVENCKAGADVIVVGNAIEKDKSLLEDMSIAIHSQVREKV